MMDGISARQRLAALTGLLGLVKPQPGSLGLVYLLVLVAGSIVAIVLGSRLATQPDRSWVILISLILWQPMIEELLFRGVLQGELRRYARLAREIVGLTPANIVVSCLFSAMHLINQSPGWALAIFIPSVTFGFFRDRCSSVLPGLVLHTAYNGFFFLSQG